MCVILQDCYKKLSRTTHPPLDRGLKELKYAIFNFGVEQARGGSPPAPLRGLDIVIITYIFSGGDTACGGSPRGDIACGGFPRGDIACGGSPPRLALDAARVSYALDKIILTVQEH